MDIELNNSGEISLTVHKLTVRLWDIVPLSVPYRCMPSGQILRFMDIEPHNSQPAISYDKTLRSPRSCLTTLMVLQTNKLKSLTTNCSRNYVYTDVINRQSALVSKRKWLHAFGHRCIMHIRQLAVPAPRQRHIYGHIV